MNWTRNSNIAKALAVAVLLVGASATMANAQEIKGSFTLPFEAHWGNVTLAPGDYTIALDPGVRSYVTVSQGTRGIGFVMTSGISDDTKSGGSAMVAVATSAGYSIATLHLQEQGVTLHFAQPKPKPTVLAQAPTMSRRVPVLLASK
jgi:hypothetical protein